MKEHADEIYKFEKYDLIMEFHRRPAMPIPFSIIPNLWRISVRTVQYLDPNFVQSMPQGKMEPLANRKYIDTSIWIEGF